MSDEEDRAEAAFRNLILREANDMADKPVSGGYHGIADAPPMKPSFFDEAVISGLDDIVAPAWKARGFVTDPTMPTTTKTPEELVSGGVIFHFATTAAQNDQVRAALRVVGLDNINVRLDVTERLGGYLVEPGGIVCADWAGVLAAIRRAWGVS